MIQLDLVSELLQRTGQGPGLPRLDAAVAWSRPGLEGALRLGSSLRLFGMRAVVDTEGRSLGAAREWRRSVGAANLLHCGGGPLVSWVAGEGRLRRLPAEQVVGRLAGGSVR